MDSKDLTNEAWREYLWCTGISADPVIRYRIVDPQKLWIGSTTHRVLDAKGMIHCVPTVGVLGCVLTWLPRDPADPVQF